MSRRPDFLRESVWRMMEEPERVAVHRAVVTSLEATARLEKAMADVELHRRLARKFADQARGLLETLKEREESEGSPPSVVRRVEALVDDLNATAGGAERREDGLGGVAAYTPPTPPADLVQSSVRPLSRPPPEPPPHPADEDEDELRVPTVVGASRRTRSKLTHGSPLDQLQEVDLDELDVEDL